MNKKLTKIQQDILDRLRKGEVCHFSRMNYYWFMSNDFKKCTKQIIVLEKLGYIETKGWGMFREIKFVSKKDASVEESA